MSRTFCCDLSTADNSFSGFLFPRQLQKRIAQNFSSDSVECARNIHEDHELVFAALFGRLWSSTCSRSASRCELGWRLLMTLLVSGRSVTILLSAATFALTIDYWEHWGLNLPKLDVLNPFSEADETGSVHRVGLYPKCFSASVIGSPSLMTISRTC